MPNPLRRLVIAFDLPSPWVARIEAEYPDLEVVLCADLERLPEVLPGAQALMAGWWPDPEQTRTVLRHGRQLAWIQTAGAGVDGMLTRELRQRNVVVTNMSGVHAHNIGEHVLAMMLAFARGLVQILPHRERREWWRPADGVFELRGQTLAVVGLGAIGQAVAQRAQALGMRVIGSRRNPTGPVPGVVRVYGQDQLHAMLSDADHVAVCLPLTDATRGLFGAEAFAAMRPGAYFYNIGRGRTVDQDALVAALRSGRLGGAGLDVTDPEPLPPDSPLWELPNTLITCHSAGMTPHYWDRAIPLLLANIGRFRAGQPLLNVVDLQEGY
ncbi:D-2-hydroxyacid dehydrogenase [Candidatus Methylocalor cossyra]|uniref:D-3-phosphoglycerate dehydrogenase n=1 Tax=Candidatus Methylocalor cossyra TaxID=3108543 RepID=A0ABP1C7W2_9GAMM